MSRMTTGALALALTLAQAGAAPSAALAQAPKQAVASAATQTDFAAFIATFRAALKANDAAAVTGMTDFSAGPYGPEATRPRTKGYPVFHGHPKAFSPSNRACIQRKKAVYERDDRGKESYAIYCYELIYTFTKTKSGFLLAHVSVDD